MKFLLGQKIEMTTLWQEDNKAIPATIIQTGPCQIVQVKTLEKDGYTALQVGFGQAKKINKPLKGHLKGLPMLKYLREVRVKNPEQYKRGDILDINQFQPGDKVKVTAISKGKGFQGVVKRHHFAGHPPTHGHKDQARMPGSIGAGGVQHVFKGTRMAGRMGQQRVTVKNLEVVKVDKEKNLLYLKGAVPGARKSLVMIYGE
jgi:large subunit ribosomal protein L3